KAKREVRRRWRNAIFFVWHGGFRTWLRWKIVFRAERMIARRLGYQYRSEGKSYRWVRPAQRTEAAP
ncbi:MAG: hypothetical protein NW217_13255, partial [Hyphomicrobiaceae bacterium]|nr:hypothetical protein [Hyphomicrobiaceae bacterium]